MSMKLLSMTAVLLAACSMEDRGVPPGVMPPAAPVQTPPSPVGAAPGRDATCTAIGAYGSENIPVFRSSDGLVAFRTDVDVNTDGALESYKIDDLGHFENGRLQTRSALNTICNGVNIRDTRDDRVFGAEECAKLIREFVRIRDFGWLEPGENYVEFYAIATIPGTQEPGRSKGKPCEKDGFYVSQVARPIDPSKGPCDPRRWVDALRVPAIVLPLDARMRAAGVGLHDLAAVRLPNGRPWVGAIVGDTNPSKIGEGTVNLVMKLRGQSTPPANYRATVALALPAADYVVFPGTASRIPDLSNESAGRIAEETQRLVEQHRLTGSATVCR